MNVIDRGSIFCNGHPRKGQEPSPEYVIEAVTKTALKKRV